jgi:hypothetical protein
MMTLAEAEAEIAKFAAILLTAAHAALDHVADDCRIAPPEVQADRERLCRACPLHDAARDRCSVCGCNLSLKRTWASSACPLPYPEWMAV